MHAVLPRRLINTRTIVNKETQLSINTGNREFKMELLPFTHRIRICAMTIYNKVHLIYKVITALILQVINLSNS